MRRSRGEIIGRILEVCMTGASKTALVYGGNLNFETVAPYIDSLTKNGFIVAMDGKYKTTEKGKELLGKLKELTEFF